MQQNIFVLGLDELNRTSLEHVFHAERYRFHGLLTLEELQADDIDLPGLLEKAERQLRDFDEPIAALVGYWDFPVSSMIPILCDRFGLRSADLAAVVKCEHKYWSRLEQRKVIDAVPAFALVDLEHDSTLPAGLTYPVWLKPVKSFSSVLAFRVSDDAEFAEATRQIADGIGRVGEPFDFVLDRLDLPPEIADVGGQACLAEESISGSQLTVEGYRFEDEVHIYGVVDSISYPGSSSFLRYEYPSTLPENMTARAAELSRTVIDRIGLDCVPFNIEYFADPVREELCLLEINPRHSQSHAMLFEYVDGVPNHQAMVRLALGQSPDLPHRQGKYAHAAKWFVRHFSDAYVRSAPSTEDVARVEGHVPGSTIELIAHEGDQLSAVHGHDSYSYELADIFIGADSNEELANKYQQCLSGLPFELEDI